MTLIIELPEEEVQALAAKARAHGVSSEQYAKLVLERDLKTSPQGQSVAQSIREIWDDLPVDVRANLPRDGASQVDHYVYGLPKRDE